MTTRDDHGRFTEDPVPIEALIRYLRKRLYTVTPPLPCACGGHGYIVEQLPDGGYYGRPCGCEHSIRPVREVRKVLSIHDGRAISC